MSNILEAFINIINNYQVAIEIKKLESKNFKIQGDYIDKTI